MHHFVLHRVRDDPDGNAHDSNHGNAVLLHLTSYILNTPNRASSMGALRQTEGASDSTRRVSEGRMMPSPQSLAVA
jgi:hypothetical protein